MNGRGILPHCRAARDAETRAVRVRYFYGCTSAASAGCAASTSLTGSDNGKTIQAHVGDEISITLDANPSTGYGWSVEKSDGTLLTLKLSNFSASSSAVGSGGTQTLTFVAKSVGTANLQLKYWRSF